MTCGNPPTVEVCFGGDDEDGDGLVDCDDPNCDSALACDPVEDCSNGLDDDGDGRIDCDDSDCDGNPQCD